MKSLIKIQTFVFFFITSTCFKGKQNTPKSFKKNKRVEKNKRLTGERK